MRVPSPPSVPFTHESLLANDNIRLSKTRFRFLKLPLHGVFWFGFFWILELLRSGLVHLPPAPKCHQESLSGATKTMSEAPSRFGKIEVGRAGTVCRGQNTLGDGLLFWRLGQPPK